MRAYICDRCKTAYTKNLTPTFGKITEGHLTGFCFMTSGGLPDNLVDLCDDCLEKLFDFMNNKTVYKTEETIGV